jgi:hypothetical protein
VYRVLIVIALAVALCSQGAAARCSIDDIRIKEWSWRIDTNVGVTILGELVNNCAEPVGVELRATVRNANGNLVEVEEFWPHSTEDIEPNSPYPFKYGFFHTAPDVATVNIEVTEVAEWSKRSAPHR